MRKTKTPKTAPESNQFIFWLSKLSAKEIKQLFDDMRRSRELQFSLEALSKLKDKVEPELCRIKYVIGASILTITYPSEYHTLIIRIGRLEGSTLRRTMNRIHRIMKKYRVPPSIYKILYF